MLKTFMVTLFLFCILTAAEAAAAEPINNGLDVGRFYVEYGAMAYHYAFGSWPTKWSQVRDAGIVQVPIISAYGGEVDPDDGTLDFVGDFFYTWTGSGLPSITARYEPNPEPVTSPLSDPSQWSSKFLSDSGTASSAELIQLQRVQSLVTTGIMFFTHIEGRVPQSWSEFIDSGLTPIDSASINPLTGRPYAGDGLPGDYLFKTRKNESGIVDAVSIAWVSLSGQVFDPCGGGMLMAPDANADPSSPWRGIPIQTEPQN
jgi:hypothetical protein